jgi:homeobox protein cut-like
MSLSSTFSKALDSWEAVQLPTIQHQMDGHAEEISSLQDTTLQSRKQLAAKTKEFKKLSDDDKLGEFKALLKLYQTEVDRLTERAKKGENAFLECYRALGEVPDPKPLLEASLESVMVASEVDDLKKQNERLREESLKHADYEQLQAKIVRLNQQNAEQLANRLKLKEEELNGGFQEKELQWKEKEESLKQIADSLQKEVLELKAQAKVDKLKLKNQKIALGEDVDEENDPEEVSVSVSDKEVELLKQELGTKETRIVNLEKRNEQLIKELSVAKSDIEQQERKLIQELKLTELESENATLVATMEYNQQQHDSSAKKNVKEINGLQAQVAKLQEECQSFNKRLSKMADYDQLKDEVSTLRAIQFGEDSEDEDEDADPVKSTHQLDEILASRNKKLTAEVADYRSRYDALNETIHKLEYKVSDQQKQITSLELLNAQLEQDLLALQSNSKYNDTMSMISGVTRNTNATFKPQGRRLSPASSIAGGGIPEEEQQSSSVLPIITSQRDRFRSRNTELETQIKKQAQLITELRSKITRLEKDNASLFEKTRYLSSFKGNVNRHGDIETQQSYSNNYEDQLHPLAKFREREQQRALSRLSPLERVFISFAKAILANKMSRMCFMGYIVGLHALVALMMWYSMALHGLSVAEVGHSQS